MKLDYKNHYSPSRWKLYKIINKIVGIKEKLLGVEKGTKEYFLLQCKREIEQIKKHIIFFQQIVDNYEKLNDTKNE